MNGSRPPAVVTKFTAYKETFDTGMVRGVSAGKGRPDLRQVRALRRLDQLSERGAVTAGYGPRNWEKGGKFSRFIQSMLRHAEQAAAGCNDEDHLAAVVWNALCMMEFQERGRAAELDDRPSCSGCSLCGAPAGWIGVRAADSPGEVVVRAE